MGNFVADAYMYGIEDAEIVLVNSGGIRAEIGKGSVTRMNLMNINPWSNEMCVIKATGQQIIDALEHGAREYPNRSGGFLQTSASLTYEIDAWKESPVILSEQGSFAGIDETKERRVSNVRYNGEPIDLDREYYVAGTLYMLTQGGDGYTMFKDTDYTQSAGCSDSELLIKYLTEGLGGVITAEQYGNAAGDGRITINESEPVTGADDDSCDNCGKQHETFIETIFCIITQFFLTLFRFLGYW